MFTILAAGSARTYAANERLDIGIVGVANRAKANLNGVAGENIVALCDVDSNFPRPRGRAFPAGQALRRFSPDDRARKARRARRQHAGHTHAVATAAGLHNGLHVYCEKPLTRTVSECRAVTELPGVKSSSRKWARRFTPATTTGASSNCYARAPSAR